MDFFIGKLWRSCRPIGNDCARDSGGLECCPPIHWAKLVVMAPTVALGRCDLPILHSAPTPCVFASKYLRELAVASQNGFIQSRHENADIVSKMWNASAWFWSLAFQIIQPPEAKTMRIAKKFCICSALVCSFASTSYGQSQTRDGALLGGVTGALIGGLAVELNCRDRYLIPS